MRRMTKKPRMRSGMLLSTLGPRLEARLMMDLTWIWRITTIQTLMIWISPGDWRR